MNALKMTQTCLATTGGKLCFSFGFEIFCLGVQCNQMVYAGEYESVLYLLASSACMYSSQRENSRDY